MKMTYNDIINLVVNWANNVELPNDNIRLIPISIGFNLCKWLNDKGVFKDNLPKELFARPDLEKFAQEEAERMSELINTLNQCCINSSLKNQTN